MEMLMTVFGVFALASLVALVRFEGNPLFAFTLLLSLASLAWMWKLSRQEPAGKRGRSGGGRPGRRNRR
jgi:hypothetical protein